MAGWNTTGCTVVVEKGKSKACIAQKTVDYDSGEGTFPRYRAQGEVWFFATMTRTVTTIYGLTKAGAEAIVNDASNNVSTWKTSTKYLGVVSVSIPFEAYTKTPTMRRVDPSGQYAVEIVEVSTVTDGTETNPYSA